jgi:hypothetical protein
MEQAGRTSKSKKAQLYNTEVMIGSNRQLPVVRIGDHDYIADFTNHEFRQALNEKNTIPMYSLPENGGTFDFWYNNKTAKVEAAPADPAKRPELVRVVMGIVKTDPQFFRQLRKDEKEAIQLFEAGKSIYNDPDGIHAWKQRYPGGLLPIVNLYGTDFFLDLRLKELRQVDDFMNKIPWKALQVTDNHFALLYDATKKNAFQGTLEQAVAHGNVKWITLPPLDKMIAEGVGRHEARQRESINKVYPRGGEQKKRRGKGI